MASGVVNIPDVPFTLRSSREQDQVLPCQEEYAVAGIYLDDVQKGFRELEFSF